MTGHRRISKNAAEVMAGDRTILFSYDEPVAIKIGERYFKTDKWRSLSTYQHIKNWLPSKVQVLRASQEEINRLASGGEVVQ